MSYKNAMSLVSKYNKIIKTSLELQSLVEAIRVLHELLEKEGYFPSFEEDTMKVIGVCKADKILNDLILRHACLIPDPYKNNK